MTTYIDPASKLYGHLDRLAALQAGERAAPVNVEIDLSNRCSLGCEWCHFAYTHTRGPLARKRAKPPAAVPGGDLMTQELAQSILLQLHDAGVRSVTWTGGGEPTLHPHFNAIVELAALTDLAQGLYTNGVHLVGSRAALLRRCLTWAYVSLDECDAESYQRSKGVDAFEKACQGIRSLVAARGSATVGVGFLLHARNWQQAPEMVALSRALGASYSQFRPTVLYDQVAPGSPAENTTWLDDCIALLRTLDAPDVICDLGRFERYRDWTGHGYATCWWAGLATVITPNGKMWRCVNKREHAGAELGDLSQEPFAAIWGRMGGPTAVVADCRVLCRGDVANRALSEILQEREHAAFI